MICKVTQENQDGQMGDWSKIKAGGLALWHGL